MATHTRAESASALNFHPKILVVEDDALVGESITKGLTKKGFEAHWVNSYSSAHAELRDNRYHAVVVDIFLTPGSKDGLTLIREIASTLEIPSIVVTSHADLSIAKEALNEGAYYLFEKPLAIDSLVDVIRKSLAEPRGLSAALERFLDQQALTPKEREVTRLIMKGLSNKEIADVTGTTEKTIKFYVTIIFDKCGAKSRTELFNLVFPT